MEKVERDISYELKIMVAFKINLILGPFTERGKDYIQSPTCQFLVVRVHFKLKRHES